MSVQSLNPALSQPLAPFVDPLPIPSRMIAREQKGRLVVSMRLSKHQFHRDLRLSSVWGYDGTVPGPTIEVERGHPVAVEWRNELKGPLPVVVTSAPQHADASGVPVQCVPGLSGGTADPKTAAFSGHAIVHLHGGLTPAVYDGWAENLIAPGQSLVFYYPMDQRAALLWYHDHVMGVTKFDVYAGLSGLWIVRDEREREIGLPERPPYEIPLLIQDRNFETDDKGQLTGRLLHKTDPEVMEAFPPFTVVNGKIWPVLEVHQAQYRFRVLNGSNARTYRLVLFKDGRPEINRIIQIGTDHGLLGSPISVPSDGLLLASAERADLLIDFSDLPAGSELTLFNTARAPFDGSRFPATNAEYAADLDGLLPYPQVMRFRVVAGRTTAQPLPKVLATDYSPPILRELVAAPHRVIVLVERELEGEPNMLTLRELAPVAENDDSEHMKMQGMGEMGHQGMDMKQMHMGERSMQVEIPKGEISHDYRGPTVTVTDAGQTTRYRVVASHFEDTTTFFPVLDQHEVWQLLNLTGDTHPIHLHLDPFQIISRRPIRYKIPKGAIEDVAISAAVELERDPNDTLDHQIDDNERGLKDTIRVNPNEIVEIDVRFTKYCGRYMYHCHILEHEDRDMMRPFVTMPRELMPFMA